MVPMRDGVKLYTQVYTPTRTTEPVPMLLLRTPCGIGNATPEQLAAALGELTDYIVVRQDIRGIFKSDGTFVMLRQPRDPSEKKAIVQQPRTQRVFRVGQQASHIAVPVIQSAR